MIPTFETVPDPLDCARCAPGERGAELLRRFDALRPLQSFVLVTHEEPTLLLQRLQQERSGLFQWASLEAGPPTWRIEIARREARAGEPVKVTEAIEWDHDRLDRLERTAFDAWGAGDSASAKEAFALFAHGLRRHVGFEEALLFPEYQSRNAGPSGSAAIAALCAEHRQILALVAAIELAIRGNVVPAHVLCSHLRDLLRAHSRNEEETLYPVTDSALTPGQREALVCRIQVYAER
jgi:uncharacterized protein (DUF2249 family)/hemerythrin-like domain-containing protein